MKEKIICPKCGAGNDADAKFCKKCGEKMQMAARKSDTEKIYADIISTQKNRTNYLKYNKDESSEKSFSKGIAIVVGFSVFLIASAMIFAIILMPGANTKKVNTTRYTPTASTEKHNETSVTLTDPKPTEYISEAPLLFYSETQTDAYKGKRVRITCLIENCEYEHDSYIADRCTFTAWMLDENNVYTPKESRTVFQDDFGGDWEIVKNMKDGDFYEFEVYVYADGSLGFHDSKYIKKIEPLTTITDAKQSFKNECKNISTDALLRYPEDYLYAKVKFSGKVIQIVDNSNSITTLRLDVGGEHNIVYVSYHKKEGEGNILEGDRITIYGYNYEPYEYETTLHVQKTVANVGAIIVEY